MSQLPEHIPLVFGITTFATLILVFRVVRSSKDKRTRRRSWWILLAFSAWLILQAYMSVEGLYSDHTDAVPPFMILFGILPSVLLGLWLFLTDKGRKLIDGFSQKRLTYIHVVRIPVEVVLWWLFLAGTIPQIMTFEGWNFDVLSGISALIIIPLAYRKRPKIGRGGLLAWNFICLGMVLFIVAIAILSAPFPFQQLAIEQPNKAVLYFPYSWLPTFVVPVVVLGHLVCLRQLLSERNN